MILNYYIVRNLATKEFWVAEPKYENSIDDIIKKLKGRYGNDQIFNYSTSSDCLSVDIAIEEHNGLKRKHFTDWEPYFVAQKK